MENSFPAKIKVLPNKEMSPLDTGEEKTLQTHVFSPKIVSPNFMCFD
jgi:hypothetical protein